MLTIMKNGKMFLSLNNNHVNFIQKPNDGIKFVFIIWIKF